MITINEYMENISSKNCKSNVASFSSSSLRSSYTPQENPSITMKEPIKEDTFEKQKDSDVKDTIKEVVKYAILGISVFAITVLLLEKKDKIFEYIAKLFANRKAPAADVVSNNINASVSRASAVQQPIIDVEGYFA